MSDEEPEENEIDEAERLEGEAEHLREQFLRRHGWGHVCDVPGSLWVWVREFEGRQLMGSTNMALHMQAAILNYGKE